MTTRMFLVAFALGLAACSSSSSNPDDAQPAPAPTAQNAQPPCDDGTYRVASGACQAYPNLTVARSSVSITPVRDHHTTAVVETAAGPYLYVFGGTEDWKTIHTDVQRAHIRDDGSLEPFEVVGQLPAPRAGHCIAKTKDSYLLVGGIVQANGRQAPDPSSVFVTLGADGKVAETKPGPSIPKGVMHLTCDVVGSYVYVLGGRGTNSQSTNMSARAKIADDGSVGPFEKQTPLVPDRSHHASFVHGGRIYIAGGLTGDPTGQYKDHDDVMSAPIGDDGALGAWEPSGKLPDTLGVTAATIYEDAVYIFGGLEDFAFTDKIRRATWNDDGTLSTWATLKTRLPGPRGHVHQLPIWKNHVYSVGGNDGSSLGNVDVGTFD